MGVSVCFLVFFTLQRSSLKEETVDANTTSAFSKVMDWSDSYSRYHNTIYYTEEAPTYLLSVGFIKILQLNKGRKKEFIVEISQKFVCPRTK